MNLNGSRRSVRPWYVIGLAGVAAVVIAIGITELGTPTSSARTSKETVTAAKGVVQTTVSGSGNVEPGVDQAVNFATGGTLQSVNVTVGQRVKKGQLIASLDPSTAELTLEEAQTSLTAAEDQLTADEDGTSSSSSSSGSSSLSSSSGASASTASVASVATPGDVVATASFVSLRKPSDDTTDTSTTTTPTTSTTTTTTSPATTTATTTTPTTTRSTPKQTTTKQTTTTPKRTTTTTTKQTTTTPKRTTTTTPKQTTNNSAKTSTAKKSASTGQNTASNTNTATTAAPTKTASAVQIAQATEQVQAAEETVKSDETAVDNTKLYAPVSGTIASLSSDTIGQTISSGGSSSGGSSSGGSSSSGSSSSAATGSAASSSGSGSSGSSSTASGSGFAEIIDSKTMTMTVSLSESDISSVKVGQVATVAISALSGVELGGHVTTISPLGTNSSGVVTYDATLTIDQTNAKVLPGMSATATIVTQQAQGVTVPNQAITGSGTNGAVELIKNGKATPQTVVVGLRGSSRSEIVSGLKAGQQVQITITLPALGTSSSSSSSNSSTLGGTSGLGGGGFGGAGGGGARAGLRAFFGGG